METTETMTTDPQLDEDLLSLYRRRNLEAMAELQSKFPNAYISNYTFFEYLVNRKDIAICDQCTGMPCKKTQWRGRKCLFNVEEGEVIIRFGNCKYLNAELRQRKTAQLFAGARLPKRYDGKTFDDYTIDNQNLNTVKWAKFAITNNQSLYWYGRPGAGKTFLAAIIAQEMIKIGRSVIFGDVPSLLDALKSTFDKNSEDSLETKMKELYSVDVLILDDLGAESNTEWAIERLYLILNERYNSDKQVIVTSNYSLPELSNRFSARKAVTGQRLASRLRQMCKVSELQGNDRRLS